jgi:hypothetical protein
VFAAENAPSVFQFVHGYYRKRYRCQLDLKFEFGLYLTPRPCTYERFIDQLIELVNVYLLLWLKSSFLDYCSTASSRFGFRCVSEPTFLRYLMNGDWILSLLYKTVTTYGGVRGCKAI